MKKTIIYLVTLMFLSLIFGCEKNIDIEGMAPGVISLSNPGYKNVLSYDIGETWQESIWIAKGGLSEGDGKVELELYLSAIDSLNLANGTAYELLPAECYDFENKIIEIPSDKDYVEGKLTYDPGKIVERIGYNNNKYLLPIKAVSKEGFPLNSDRNNLFLNFKVSEPIVTILNPGTFEIDLSDENITTMDVNVGVVFTNKWDIKTNFMHKQEVIDAYNTRNGTYYAMLDESAYEAPEEILIKKGSKSTIASYVLNKANILPGNYILPCQIKSLESSLEGTPTDVIKADIVTSALFLLSKMGELIPKGDWTIESFTTQEPAEAKWGNGGSAIHLIDDNPDTYWHSKWKNGRTPLPYQITIDIKKESIISQIKILPRGRGSNNPIHLLDFETSIDGTNWQFVGRFEFVNSNAALLYPVQTTNAKYIRMTIPDEGGNGTVAAIRELTAYGKVL